MLLLWCKIFLCNLFILRQIIVVTKDNQIVCDGVLRRCLCIDSVGFLSIGVFVVDFCVYKFLPYDKFFLVY